ncbi:MAG: RNA polymerase sigma factor RpoE [Gammaproteobacteria bacterium]|uniref:RNA polymerase sigma-70 factor (ECF subfamily) n=1 Tax=Tolumonas osonensis TaxID=675874 RepID=A0A841GRS6_9GAMM|nr:RNA polymerase sigma factor RpoE [Tolumonas osonensis]MBB6056403.1 RNA polymerase sigma-70 factor (ECF subfamily) [Tolumonas osonensis]NCB59760.1 RNA polymerase sigma factor RpoE [Gammaproteobacteria bacterium]
MSDSDIEIDQQLVERVQRGDKQAFNLLVTKYQRKIMNLVSRYVSNSGDIADVVQEVFISAYRFLPSFRNDSAFYTWLYRIAVNTAKNYLVSNGRRPPGVDVDIIDAEQYDSGEALRDIASPERLLSSDQVRQTVMDALQSLPEDLRTVITLRELEGLSYEEIAEIIGCPVGTVRSRIFRAREFIDNRLKAVLQGID